MVSMRYLVHDVDQAIAFYTQLGFALRQQFGPAMAIVARDDLTLWLAGPRASAASPMPDGRLPEPGGWNRFVLQVADLADLVATLRARGVTFRNDIVEGPGGRQILCEDPSGNVVELFEPASVAVARSLRGLRQGEIPDLQVRCGTVAGDQGGEDAPRCFRRCQRKRLCDRRHAASSVVEGATSRTQIEEDACDAGGSTDVAISAISAPRRRSCGSRTPARRQLRRRPPPRSPCRQRHGRHTPSDRRPCRTAGTPALARPRRRSWARVICRGSPTRMASSGLMGRVLRRFRRYAWPPDSCPQGVDRSWPTR